MTIVFALLLCGAVSAEDSQEVGGIENSTINSSTEDTSAIIDPEITLNINLEHPEALSGDKLPNVKVTDNDGNTINGITITKSGDNQYKVNFISKKNIFNLNVVPWDTLIKQ
jgi:cobaltochelatase CobN